jgi:hypothetical protein
MNVQYVGITGITTPHEYNMLSGMYSKLNLLKPALMVGILVSTKVLNKEATSLRFVSLENIPIISSWFKIDELNFQLLNVYHYNTKNIDNKMFSEMDQLVDRCIVEPDGFQLNIYQPHLESIEMYVAKYSPKIMILQLKSLLLAQPVSDILAYIHKYQHVITHVLLDGSEGLGIEVNYSLFQIFLIPAIREMFPGLKIGIAGGLSGKNLADLGIQKALQGGISIDTESRVRVQNDSGLDFKKTKLYLEKAVQLYNRV